MFKLFIETIKFIYWTKKALDYEHKGTPYWGRKAKKKDIYIELESKETVTKEAQTNQLLEGKEGLALAMLLAAKGNEANMNEACDLIKQLGLVDEYK